MAVKMECVCLWVCLNFGVSACRLYNDTTTAHCGETAEFYSRADCGETAGFIRGRSRPARPECPVPSATAETAACSTSRSSRDPHRHRSPAESVCKHKHTHLENMPRRQTLHDIVISLSLSLRFNGHFLRGPGTVCRRN